MNSFPVGFLVILLVFLFSLLIIYPLLQQRNLLLFDLSLPYYDTYYYGKNPYYDRDSYGTNQVSTISVVPTNNITVNPMPTTMNMNNTMNVSSPTHPSPPTHPSGAGSGAGAGSSHSGSVGTPQKEGLQGFYKNSQTEEQAIGQGIVTELSGKSVLLKPTHNKIPLSQMSVFSSWNTAQSGEFVSTEQIINVLSTGCRMVHFTVTNFNHKPMIFGKRFTNEKDGILLDEAIQTCMNYAYRANILLNFGKKNKKGVYDKKKSKTIPLQNHTDPLIIVLSFHHFTKQQIQEMEKHKNRMILPTYDTSFLDLCGKIVKKGIGNRRFKHKLTIHTKMNELTNHALFLTDVSTLYSMKLIGDYESSSLKTVTHLICGHSDGVMLYPFTELMEQEAKIVRRVNDMIATDVYDKSMIFTMAVPSDKKTQKTKNPTSKQFMYCTLYQRCQFIPIAFYERTNLNQLIDFFEEHTTAFIPFQTMYIQTIHNDDSKAVMG